MAVGLPVYLSLGGNLGDPLVTIKKCLEILSKQPLIELDQVSSFYLTSPIGNPFLPNFINAVCRVYTTLEIESFFKIAQQIEKELGKIPKGKQDSRPIDIDILFFGENTFDNGVLQIPHARWKERLFVLVPLLELTSTVVINCGHEIQSFYIQELINKCKNSKDLVSLYEKNSH